MRRRIVVGSGRGIVLLPWLAFAVSLGPGAAEAGQAVIIVDADAPSDGCPGQGTEADPYGSLQCALESGSLAPGVCIQLRDAAVPYAGADTGGLGLPAGTASEPIVIEPYPGHAPILDGALTLADADHWRIRGLVFDGSAGHTGTDAVTITGGVGTAIENVVIVGWDAQGIVLRGSDDTTLRGNRIDGALGHGIWVQDAQGTVIEGNEVASVQCEPFSFDMCIDCGPDRCFACGDCLSLPDAECVTIGSFTVGGQIGIRVLGTSTGTDVDRNWFHDFPGGGCGVDATNAAAIFITGRSVQGGRFHHNLVERIAPDGGPNDVGHAVLMFQEAADWLVDHNVIVDPGTCGLCEGNPLFYGATGSMWEHNTVIGGRYGIDVRRGPGGNFVNNLIAGSTDAPVRVQSEALDTAPTLDHNLYFDESGGTVVGAWGDATGLDLAGWQAACACDAGSASGDPGLPSGGYTPASTSPAIDLGFDFGPPFHGAAPDAGALEAPRLSGATVPTSAPDTVLVDLENRSAPPLAAQSCGGLQVIVDDVPQSPTGCSSMSDEQVVLELAEPIVAGQVVRVRPDRGTVRDSARIGNRIDAWLGDEEITADNMAPAGSGGTGGVGTDDTGNASGGGSGDGDGGESQGCGCATSGRAHESVPLCVWILLILPQRQVRRYP